MNPRQDFLHRGQAADAFVAAGEVAGGGTDEMAAVFHEPRAIQACPSELVGVTFLKALNKINSALDTLLDSLKFVRRRKATKATKATIPAVV